MVVDDMNDGMKVVALGYVMNLIICISWGRFLPSDGKVFVAMVANVVGTNMLWHQCFGHTNFGSL